MATFKQQQLKQQQQQKEQYEEYKNVADIMTKTTKTVAAAAAVTKQRHNNQPNVEECKQEKEEHKHEHELEHEDEEQKQKQIWPATKADKTNLKQRKQNKINVNKVDSSRITSVDKVQSYPPDMLYHRYWPERVNQWSDKSINRNRNNNILQKYTTTRSAGITKYQKQRQCEVLKSTSFNSKQTTLTATTQATRATIKSTFERLNSNCKVLNWRLDTTRCMMLTMFVVATVVISGNAALAAQRDPFKVKDTKGINSNVNAIPSSDINSNENGNGNGNIANINGENTNSGIGIGNGYGDDDGDGDGITGIGIQGAPAAVITTSTSTTSRNSFNQTTVTSISSATATTTNSSGLSSKSATFITGSVGGNAIASGSLHKISTANSHSANGNTGINRNAIEMLEERTGPYFDKAASKNVTALLGKTAYLNCRVKNLGNKTMLLQVSWVRHRDIHLLTVGRYTYTSDQRFRAIHQPQTEDWILQIKYPQHRDSGIYECQVSTTPHMSHYIHLNVVEPSTEIIGAPDLYIESGSTINLTCVILNSPEPPAYIFWNHNNAIINYDSPRGGVSVVTNKGETTTSFLLIKTARPSDSGLYQCNPSNAKPKSVTVHVLNGEFPAAMQRAVQAHHRMSQSHYLLVYLSLYLFTLAYVGHFMKPSQERRSLSQSQLPQLSPLLITEIDGIIPCYGKESRVVCNMIVTATAKVAVAAIVTTTTTATATVTATVAVAQ